MADFSTIREEVREHYGSNVRVADDAKVIPMAGGCWVQAEVWIGLIHSGGPKRARGRDTDRRDVGIVSD